MYRVEGPLRMYFIHYWKVTCQYHFGTNSSHNSLETALTGL